MVRVLLNHNKRRRVSRQQQLKKRSVEPTPTLEATSSDSSIDDDDFFIPDGEDKGGGAASNSSSSSSYIPKYIPGSSRNNLSASIRSSISLERLDEECPTDTPVAVAFLEIFFFGGTQASKIGSKEAASNERTAKKSAPTSYSFPSSPTSTLIPPFPGSTNDQRQRYATREATMYLSERPTTIDISHQSSDHDDRVPENCHFKDYERTQSMPMMQPPSMGSPARPKKPVLKRSGNSTSSLNSSKRNVSFTEIRFREYEVSLSHHPSCSFGPPIELGWQYSESESLPVEDYEGKRSPRRETHELLLSYNVRRRMLLKQGGYSKEDLREAEREVDRIKRGRMMTEVFLPAQAIDESLERFVGFLKRAFLVRPGSPAACE